MIAAAWEPITAIATLALATVTAGLALSTRKLAREAGAETRANWRPVVALGELATSGGYSYAVHVQDGSLWVGLNNIGRGPALTVRASLRVNESESGPPARGKTASEVIEPGGRLMVEWPHFSLPRVDDVGIRSWVPIQGTISYGDISYARYGTDFVVGFSSDGQTAILTQVFQPTDAYRPTQRERAGLLFWRFRTATEIPLRRAIRKLRQR